MYQSKAKIIYLLFFFFQVIIYHSWYVHLVYDVAKYKETIDKFIHMDKFVKCQITYSCNLIDWLRRVFSIKIESYPFLWWGNMLLICIILFPLGGIKYIKIILLDNACLPFILLVKNFTKCPMIIIFHIDYMKYWWLTELWSIIFAWIYLREKVVNYLDLVNWCWCILLIKYS